MCRFCSHGFTPELIRFYNEAKVPQSTACYQQVDALCCAVCWHWIRDHIRFVGQDKRGVRRVLWQDAVVCFCCMNIGLVLIAVCLRCALPYGDPKIEKLKSKEGVQKIPSLVVYREDGSLVQSFGNAQFCRHDVTEVGLHSMGGVSLVLDAWQQVSASSHVHFPDSWFQGIKPVVPAQVTLSFDMDDDF